MNDDILIDDDVKPKPIDRFRGKDMRVEIRKVEDELLRANTRILKLEGEFDRASEDSTRYYLALYEVLKLSDFSSHEHEQRLYEIRQVVKRVLGIE